MVISWVKNPGQEIQPLQPEIEQRVTTNRIRRDVPLGDASRWHFIRKTQKCWVWLVWDRQRKRCLGVQLGGRNIATSKSSENS
jgi:hypothetical protein